MSKLVFDTNDIHSLSQSYTQLAQEIENKIKNQESFTIIIKEGVKR